MSETKGILSNTHPANNFRLPFWRNRQVGTYRRHHAGVANVDGPRLESFAVGAMLVSIHDQGFAKAVRSKGGQSSAGECGFDDVANLCAVCIAFAGLSYSPFVGQFLA